MNRINNNKDVENVSAEIINSYLLRIGRQKGSLESIDIDDLVSRYLKCKVVIESIYMSADCLGYLSNGVSPIMVYRKGEIKNVVFPKDTIVIDRYLYTPGQETKRRFVLAHEAGHLITGRINKRSCANCYHDNSGVMAIDKQDLVKRFSVNEVFANRFAACLLMPADTVKNYIRSYFDRDTVPLDEKGNLSSYDHALLKEIAGNLKVSITTFLIRLNELELFEMKKGVAR